ncbi:MAG: sulfotransferase [Candidatus Sericytochromatia bacterium]
MSDNPCSIEQLTAFAPGEAETLELPAGLRLLTMLGRQHGLAEVESVCRLLAQVHPPLVWVLYLLPDCSLDAEVLAERLATETLEIVLFGESASDERPPLLAACQAYLDLHLQAQPPAAYFQALAMNRPVLCAPGQPAGPLPPEGLRPVSDPAGLAAALEQPAVPGLRGRLISRLAESDAAGFRGWLDPQLQWLADEYTGLELAVVMFWGRSGSTLLSSLLDSHPQTVTIGAGNFGAISLFSNVWSYLRQAGLSSLAELLEHFCAGRRRENMAPHVQELALFSAADPAFEASFKQYFHQLIQALGQNLGLTQLQQQIRKVFFVGLHFAYALALGQDIRGRRQIVFQAHWCEDLEQLSSLCQDFPRMKLLGMIRQPAQGFYSLLAYYRQEAGRQWPDLVFSGHYTDTYRHLLMGWTLAEKMIGTPVYAIALEALHAQPEAVIRALAGHLELAWHPCLLESSCDGTPYRVGSGVHGLVDRQLPVFDPQRVNYDQWRQQLSDLDVFVLEGLMHEPLKKYLGRSVSPFQQSLGLLLLFLPMRLEWQALQQAFALRDEQKIKQVLLGLAERCFYSLLHTCGYAFKSNPGHRIRPKALLGLGEGP